MLLTIQGVILMLKACGRVHSSQQGLIMLFNKAILEQRVIHSGRHQRVCLSNLQDTTCLIPPLNQRFSVSSCEWASS